MDALVTAPERSVITLPSRRHLPEGVQVTASVIRSGGPITLRVSDLGERLGDS
ncbi:hypothetical protein ACFVX6_30995 [Streptomyces sp. NPDC058289]|uniref:hypothetical protein n=1 Tax=Streptomyces sp. NPDC058289 TaxID=3346425 RepID=UPI0036EAFEB9